MGIFLHNIDCMEAMKNMDDNQYDLAIVDPPYGSENINGGYAKGMGGGIAKTIPYNNNVFGYSAPDESYFEQLFRVSKNQIIWGANHFISKMAIDSPGWIVWNKKTGDSHFADCELAYTSFQTAVRMFSFMWSGFRQENMANKEKRIHPTQKPVALYKWLLDKYANPGDKILDTHLGSGSIAIACHDYGYDLDAYEIDPDYYSAAVQRLKDHQSQLKMF